MRYERASLNRLGHRRQNKQATWYDIRPAFRGVIFLPRISKNIRTERFNKEDSMKLLTFIIISIIIIAAAFAIAYAVEMLARKKANSKEKILTTRKIVTIGVMSAIGTILMIFDFPLPLVPTFYKMDLSLLPVLITGFAYGPVAAVFTEFIKIALKLLIKGSGTAYVGDLASLIIGLCYVLPATIIYYKHKTKKAAIISCIVGCVVMTVSGALLNAFYLIPAYIDLFFKGNDAALYGVAQKVNPAIKDVTGLVFLGAVPLNLVKSIAVSILALLIYKPLRKIVKE